MQASEPAKKRAYPRFKELVAHYNLKNADDAARLDQSGLGKQFACSFEHLSSSDFAKVYEPSEDTFLLVDALHIDLPTYLEQRGGKPPEKVLEVG
jgi:methylase of polypeptide subunit release factors